MGEKARGNQETARATPDYPSIAGTHRTTVKRWLWASISPASAQCIAVRARSSYHPTNRC